MSMNPVTSVSTVTGAGWANTSSQVWEDACGTGYADVCQRAKPSRAKKATASSVDRVEVYAALVRAA